MRLQDPRRSSRLLKRARPQAPLPSAAGALAGDPRGGGRVAVGGVNCLVNSSTERDLNLLNRYTQLRLRGQLLRGTLRSPVSGRSQALAGQDFASPCRRAIRRRQRDLAARRRGCGVAD